MTPWLDPAGVQTLGWTLVHFLWQGALAAALLASLDVICRRRSAGLRYVLASLTLLAMLALPVATFFTLRSAAPEARSLAESEAAPSPVARGADWLAAPAVAPRLRESLAPLLPALVAAWCVGVALLSVRTLGGWALAQRLKRSGRPTAREALTQMLARLCRGMRIWRPVRLCESALIEVPTVIGWLQPVILLPASTLAGLSPVQLEVILAHELAHIRRLDYLVNLLQTVAETLLFYHPAMWWVSHRMRVEREHCCDDAAVVACGDPLGYARALADLEGLRGGLPSLALAVTGGSLFRRVARLVSGPPPHAARASRWLAGLVALASVALAAGAIGSLRAQAGDPPSKAKPAQERAPKVAPPEIIEDPAGAEEEESPEDPVEAPCEDQTEEPCKDQTEEPSEDVVEEAFEDHAEDTAEEPSEEPAQEASAARRASGRGRDLTVDQIIELARAGVTPEYVDEMAAAGYPSLPWEQLLDLRRHGVGPDYVKGLAAEGYKGLAVDQLLALRNQGVGADFIRGLKAEGLANLSLSDLLGLRAQGVSPDFVREMKEAGYGGLSANDLVGLRAQGVSPAFVEKFKGLGYRDLPLRKLIALRSMGVTPQYVSELKELGYADLPVPVLIGLRSQGVGPEFVREMKALGYDRLPAGLLIQLRAQGVTPEFVKELKDAGYDRLSTQELIELRANGVRIELLKRLKSRP